MYISPKKISQLKRDFGTQFSFYLPLFLAVQEQQKTENLRIFGFLK